MIFRKGMIYETHVWREAQDTYSELAQTYMYTLTHTCPVKARTSGVTMGDTQRQHRRSHHDSVSAATWFRAACLQHSPYRTRPHVTSVNCVWVCVCVWLLSSKRELWCCTAYYLFWVWIWQVDDCDIAPFKEHFGKSSFSSTFNSHHLSIKYEVTPSSWLAKH